MRKHNHSFPVIILDSLFNKIQTLSMKGVVMFSGKTSTIEIDEVEITHTSFYLPLIYFANLTPKRGEKNFHPIVIDRNIVDDGYIALYLFIDFTELCFYIDIIVLVFSGKQLFIF